MAELKIVAKDNHLLFENGRFYVTETPYKDGRQTDWPKKIDVTDDVKKAIMPKTFIDIDKFICSLCKNGYGTISMGDIKYALKEQGIIYKDGSLIKIDSKKCEGKLKEMLDEKVLANSCKSCKNSQRIVSAKAKEEVYSSADLTEFELKLKKLFDLTAFAAHDTGKTLIEIARRIIVDEIDEDTINEMVGDRAEHCGNPCTLYYEGSVKNYRKGILDTLELIKKG